MYSVVVSVSGAEDGSSSRQKARARPHGTQSITRTVSCGLSPAAVSSAYDPAPTTPAAPVPEDQAEITDCQEYKVR